VAAEPLARLDYISVTDADTLEQLEKLDDRTVLIALAVGLGKTRLIDNIVLNRKKNGSSSEST
jgi:pantoate--beta-alanine ligase